MIFTRKYTKPARTMPTAIPLSQRRNAVFARMDVPAAPPQAKTEYLRSPALLKACREIPCQECGAQDGTVCAAHSNRAVHGKGRGLKASDLFVASLCARCHTALDQGRDMTRAEREAMWLRAHRCTVHQLVRLGLWPDGIPIPSTN